MDPLARFRCSTSVKAFVAVGLLALVICGSALAKFGISIKASDTTPAVGQQITLVVRSERALEYDLRSDRRGAGPARIPRRRHDHR